MTDIGVAYATWFIEYPSRGGHCYIAIVVDMVHKVGNTRLVWWTKVE